MQGSGWETIFFYAFGVMALFASLVVVTARNAVHSALALISTLVSVAALFILLRAEFLAGVQVFVYVGGVMVLFLFVIMLVNVGREERGETRLFTRQAGAAGLVAIVLAVAFVLAANAAIPVLERAAPPVALEESRGGVSRDTESVGADLYSRAALPFEIASVVLLIAIVGAVLLARERKQERMFER
jgi:NADH-quinone oxidoreductase subunit J